MQLATGDADVACSGEQLMQQGSTLLIGTGVVRSQQRKQIALGLIGNHLDDVGQVLSFGCGLTTVRWLRSRTSTRLGTPRTSYAQLLPSLPWAI